MIYLLIAAVLGVWVAMDATKRGTSDRLAWGFGTFLLAVVVMPFYFAKRNLLAGEVREGGMGWNACKNFALLWTVFMIFVGIMGMVGMSSAMSTIGNDTASQAGAGLGAMLGIGFLGMMWFFPVLGALVLGLLLRKTSIVERGGAAA